MRRRWLVPAIFALAIAAALASTLLAPRAHADTLARVEPMTPQLCDLYPDHAVRLEKADANAEALMRKLALPQDGEALKAQARTVKVP